ncbi:hypothetical protein TNCV_4895471 [Trichonephila clavipes]|nr:hypothetical protein TNCV_4895471 [Trichonephila clavipes]
MTTLLFTCQTWLHEHDDMGKHVTWCPEHPGLNIIECLWLFLENTVHAQFPTTRTLSYLETALQKEWPSTAEDPPCRGRCTLNLSRAQTSPGRCEEKLGEGDASSGIILVS